MNGNGFFFGFRFRFSPCSSSAGGLVSGDDGETVAEFSGGFGSPVPVPLDGDSDAGVFRVSVVIIVTV
ncbi:hypothetical protein HanPSC8_Chr13g0567331 [Helianthus annuus]|nr:hypothetical protein HanPSC8_Chr13g0567331 [Helianthus annuus]